MWHCRKDRNPELRDEPDERGHPLTPASIRGEHMENAPHLPRCSHLLSTGTDDAIISCFL